MIWTEDRIALLTKLWTEGLSGSQIGREMGTTRNSAIGKVHRLGLPGRVERTNDQAPKGGRKPRKPKPSLITSGLFAGYRIGRQLPAPRPEPKEEPAVIEVPAEGFRCTFMDLTPTSCRWPIGDPRAPDFHFCGMKTVEGLSYCGDHDRRAYQPGQVERRRRAAGEAG